jgi:hypothetical protein
MDLTQPLSRAIERPATPRGVDELPARSELGPAARLRPPLVHRSLTDRDPHLDLGGMGIARAPDAYPPTRGPIDVGSVEPPKGGDE